MNLFQKSKNWKNLNRTFQGSKSIYNRVIQFNLIVVLCICIVGCKAYTTQPNPETQVKAVDGDVNAQFNMAKAYADTGNKFFITTESRSENLEESVEWLEKAAAQGHPEAQFHLARYYAVRENDYERAFNMMKPLAEQGFAQAQYILSIHYYYAWGTPKDLALAYKWKLLALDGGYGSLRSLHYYLVYTNKLSHNDISEGQKMAQEHSEKYGRSKLFD